MGDRGGRDAQLRRRLDPGGAPWVGNHYGLQHARLDTGDAEKVTYMSPKLGGVQIGVTYSPNRDQQRLATRGSTPRQEHNNGLEGAINYVGKFGDVGFGIGAGMTSYQGRKGMKKDDKSDWLIASRIDFGGGFRIAAAHKRVTDDNKANESQLTDVGVRFVQGANSFSLTGSMGKMEKTATPDSIRRRWPPTHGRSARA